MVNIQEDKGSNIILIGFMATGKTTMAKELSKYLGMDYLDIDKFIEENMKVTIPDIFKKHGEKYFRQIEKEAIKDIGGLENTIISCGGGACLDRDNIMNIKKAGKVILLEADPETILKRTRNDNGSRPLLENKKGIEEIRKIMDERKNTYYKSADIIIDTSGKSISDLRDYIIKELNL